jgi:hypothetical protein
VSEGKIGYELARQIQNGGYRAAAIITAGFSKVGNVAAEQEIKRVADLHGVRFAGPNCAGLVNTAHHLFPTLETRPPAGGLVTVSWLPFRYPEINEVDLNPVFLFAEGLLVGDIRVIRRA